MSLGTSTYEHIYGTEKKKSNRLELLTYSMEQGPS